MWKIVVGFVVFAAIAMYVIMKGGDSLDLGGEKHGADTAHTPSDAATAHAPGASAPTAVGSAAK